MGILKFLQISALVQFLPQGSRRGLAVEMGPVAKTVVASDSGLLFRNRRNSGA